MPREYRLEILGHKSSSSGVNRRLCLSVACTVAAGGIAITPIVDKGGPSSGGPALITGNAVLGVLPAFPSEVHHWRMSDAPLMTKMAPGPKNATRETTSC